MLGTAMATITKLKVQKRDKDRVGVYLDGEYAFSVSVIAAANLRREQVLSAEEVADLRREGDAHLAYQRAVRYLGYRPRSSAETKSYLAGKGYCGHIVDEVVSRLERQGYLDDLAFARFWVQNREEFRPRGRRALQYELRQKGVSQHDIDAVLADYEESEAAWNAVSKRLDRWASLDESTFKQRVMGHLDRRGFPYEICLEMADKAWRDVQERS
jgi:regulatory protein